MPAHDLGRRAVAVGRVILVALADGWTAFLVVVIVALAVRVLRALRALRRG